MLLSISILFSFLSISYSQFFNPNMDDKYYLDTLQNDLEAETIYARNQLKEHAKVVLKATEKFIETQLKTNVFIALKPLAERELGIDRGRQDGDENEEEEDEEESDNDISGSSEGVNTTSTTTQKLLIPKVANILSLLFGGNRTVTFLGSKSQPANDMVESTLPLLSVSPEKQFLGVVEFLLRDQKERENVRESRQESRNLTVTVKPEVQAETTTFDPLDLGFEEEATTKKKRIVLFQNLKKNVDYGLDIILKALPDIFKGAKEAYKLYGIVYELLEDIDERIFTK